MHTVCIQLDLHDRAGTFASLLYKAEKPSVCIFSRHVDNSVISAWINSGLDLWLVLVLSFMEFVFINL